ncbi:hypothetical protein [Halalkalicoccus jeotgali]|uniref:Uncharacterized protein n=1 Tax=Halalkalicoccus jeotgali (strain DSM 18796 / CECT 7217 / JCM 14584 / KCTC 4019 / B3) TaxID=795797 RepID=D8J544_HALJB|nr:hypothetical protein [Halalkalicoccus jeotgali]ADJ13625.1 hypothetical protein HacjB3_01160 [Halalkalicoccus jeotgali B3]ELY33353.1 hypothetical protein C497_18172 [Halalkalicoccus jeotgali B3]
MTRHSQRSGRPTRSGRGRHLLEQNLREKQETLAELAELGEEFDSGRIEA